MRVSQQMLYNTYVSNMNKSLSDLVDTNIQSQTQKRVNKPSDDPIGMARILDHREALASISQYRDNISTAKGWLNLSDTTLTQLSTIITRAKALCEQAAPSTVTRENREQMSYEIRQLFGQMINLSNTEFDGKSIYAGHKVDQNAFEETLWMTTNDPAVGEKKFTIQGASEKSLLVQFTSSGTVGTDNLEYRFSKDGGKTFVTKQLTAPQTTLDLGGVTLDLEAGTPVKANAADNTNDTNGTWLWVRPTARYKGDDEDGATVSGIKTTLSGGNTKAEGAFPKDVVVRIDNATDLASNIEYSFSLDGGTTWVKGNSKSADGTASNAVLVVPGGTLTIASNGGNALASGAQFIIRPDMADIDFQIQENEEVQVNDVGKDIFGGIYKAPGQSGSSPVFSHSSEVTSNAGDSNNLFETMGNLIAFLETNNQEGIGDCLEALKKSHQQVLTKAADVGGRETRLSVADNVLSSLQIDEKERISSIEDADIGELMTKLSQQQIAYQAVLKSSSVIMKLNLMDFV